MSNETSKSLRQKMFLVTTSIPVIRFCETERKNIKNQIHEHGSIVTFSKNSKNRSKRKCTESVTCSIVLPSTHQLSQQSGSSFLSISWVWKLGNHCAVPRSLVVQVLYLETEYFVSFSLGRQLLPLILLYFSPLSQIQSKYLRSVLAVPGVTRDVASSRRKQ